MTPAEAVAAFVAFLGEHAAEFLGPAEREAIAEAHAAFLAAHPKLGPPPPADRQATIDAKIDAELARMQAAQLEDTKPSAR